MKVLPQDATDQHILDTIAEWVLAMAREDYSAAWDLTYHPAERDWDISPDLLRTLVTYYGSPEPCPVKVVYKVTSLVKPRVLEDGRVLEPRRNVKRYSDTPGPTPAWGPTFEECQRERAPANAVAYVWYDIGLNGELSDLTALFDVVRHEEGLVLILNELHVM